jgi:hypothetical protein
MNGDELWVFRNGNLDKLELITRPDRPLSYASVIDGEDKNSIELAGLLGSIGSAPIQERYPVLANKDDLVEFTKVLSELCRRGRYFDQAWPCLVPSANAALPVVDGHRVLLLTRTQLLAINPSKDSITCLLSNRQLLRTVGQSSLASLDRKCTLELQLLKFAGHRASFGNNASSLVPNEIILQASPSSPYVELLRSSHSYYCILNPVHRSSFGKGYVMLRNGYIEHDYPEAMARLPVLVKYDDNISARKIALDFSSLIAIGLPPGHHVGVSPAGGDRADLRRRILGNRHCLARVHKTTISDMEKPIARLPEAAFDILGIAPGDNVVAESILHGTSPSVTRITLRALPEREHSDFFERRIQTGLPNYESIIGAEDLLMINIDLNARQALGVTPGSTVYIRPAVTSILGREFAAISLVMIGAIFSAAALSNEPAAVVAGALYVALAAVIAISRLR